MQANSGFLLSGRRSRPCVCRRRRGKSPENSISVLKRVKFLEGLGLSRTDAAETAGSSAASVREMQSRKRRAKHGRAKTKTRAGR
jgi:hypothetical protein